MRPVARCADDRDGPWQVRTRREGDLRAPTVSRANLRAANACERQSGSHAAACGAKAPRSSMSAGVTPASDELNEGL